MVTYQVQIPESNQEAFLNIIRSLQSLGVISSFSASDNLAQPGTPIPVESLLAILKTSEQQVTDGVVIPADQVGDYMRSWRANR